MINCTSTIFGVYLTEISFNIHLNIVGPDISFGIIMHATFIYFKSFNIYF